MWYGLKKTRSKKNLRNLKYRLNLSINSVSFFLNKRSNFKTYVISLYVPSIWNFIIIKNNDNLFFLNQIFFYSNFYYFYNFYNSYISNIKYDPFSNNLLFFFKYKNNFFKLYWTYFKIIFFNFSGFFFKRLKFKGKGYYIYKNSRNTVALQFGYSHIVRLYVSYIKIKFLSKTSIIFYGLNKNDVYRASYELFNKKPINIFTGRGIRFNKQIIYKKAGKISSYR